MKNDTIEEFIREMYRRVGVDIDGKRYARCKGNLNSIYGISVTQMEAPAVDYLRRSVCDFIDNTTGLFGNMDMTARENTSIAVGVKIWLEAAANHIAIECRSLPREYRVELLREFASLMLD